MDAELLDKFEQILEDGLVKVCRSFNLLDGQILRTPDIEAVWNDRYLKDYVADAVENYNSYPDVSLAWAAFLGMGVAHWWDRAWSTHCDAPYSSYYGPHGFDDMDEHILQDVLGLDLDGSEAKNICSALSGCAAATQGLIRHEGIEAQTEEGFFILVRAYSAFYRVGASIELRRAGYKKVIL